MINYHSYLSDTKIETRHIYIYRVKMETSQKLRRFIVFSQNQYFDCFCQTIHFLDKSALHSEMIKKIKNFFFSFSLLFSHSRISPSSLFLSSSLLHLLLLSFFFFHVFLSFFSFKFFSSFLKKFQIFLNTKFQISFFFHIKFPDLKVVVVFMNGGSCVWV